MRPKYTPEQRLAAFWDKVDKSGGPDSCWLWKASKNKKGYGKVFWEGRKEYAHRISWILAYGAIEPGLSVLHNCPNGDNSSCVNPAHLWAGTIAANNADMIAKGRHVAPNGERNGRAVLSDKQVNEVRLRFAKGGISIKRLAREYGVSASHMSKLIRFEKRKQHAPYIIAV